jgi:hypothetical protein
MGFWLGFWNQDNPESLDVHTGGDTPAGRRDRETAQKDKQHSWSVLILVLVISTSPARRHIARLPIMGSLPDWEC